MQSIDGIRRAEAPPFLYKRILAGLNTPKRNAFENLSMLISRPVIVIPILIVIICADISVYKSAINFIPEDSGVTAEDYTQSAEFADLLLYGVPDNEYDYIY